MISEELKQEWLEKVSVGKREDIVVEGYRGGVTVNTPLRTAPEEVQLDKDIVERALLSGQEYFWNIHKSLKADKDFILDIIKKGYQREVYDHMHYSLQNNEEIFRQCILKKEKILEYRHLDESLVKNKALILELLPHYNFYRALEGAYRQDKEVLAVYMLHHTPHYFNRLEKRMANYFKKNKPFLVELLKKYPEAYKEINQKLLTDLEIIDSLLSNNPKNIAWLPLELRDDKGFMHYAIEKYGCTLTDAQSCHINDLELLKLSIKKNGKDIFNSMVWSNSSELLEIAMQTEPYLNKVDSSVWKDIDLVIKYLDKEEELKKLRDNKELPSNSPFHYNFPNNLGYLLNTIIPKLREQDKPLYKEYITNKHIIKKVIEKDIGKLNLFPGWKNDPELCDMAFKISNSIAYLHDSKLYDREYMLDIIQGPGKSGLIKDLSNLTNYYMNDYDFLDKFLDIEPNLIQKSPVGKADRNIINRLLFQTHFSDINFIDTSLLSDKNLVLKFIEKTYLNYHCLPLKLKQDDDIINKLLEHKISGAKVLIEESGFGGDINFYKRMVNKTPFFYEAIDENSPFKVNREIIEGYLDALVAFEANSDKSRETKFPMSVLLKYDIENSSASQLRPNFLKYDLEKSLAIKDEVIAPKKLKL
jgi:hypothetical protein